VIAIDGDQMIYASGFAAEGEPLSHALHLIKKKVEQVQLDCDDTDYQIFIKGKGNFREEVPEYKGTRSARKPSHFGDITRYMVEVLGAQQVNGMEADDKVSILLYQDYLEHKDPDECRVIVSSPDKDLNNTPGWHYNPTRRSLTWISELQATRHFCYQMLMGDTVDNVKGLPSLPEEIKKLYGIKAQGVGPATAKKLLANVETAEDSLAFVCYLYHHWGADQGYDEAITHDYLQEQGMLLWMLRDYEEVFSTYLIEDSYAEGYRQFTKGGPFKPGLK